MTSVALRLMLRTRGGSATVWGVLVPHPQGVHPARRLTGIGQYLERSMALLRFYDFVKRRREASVRRHSQTCPLDRSPPPHTYRQQTYRGLYIALLACQQK